MMRTFILKQKVIVMDIIKIKFYGNVINISSIKKSDEIINTCEINKKDKGE